MKTTIGEQNAKFKPCKRILGADLISAQPPPHPPQVIADFVAFYLYFSIWNNENKEMFFVFLQSKANTAYSDTI